MDINTANNQQEAMLSTKNLTILEDQLNHEALCTKKLSLYASYCDDQKLKNLCNQAAQSHKKHYTQLLNFLNSHNKPSQQ